MTLLTKAAVKLKSRNVSLMKVFILYPDDYQVGYRLDATKTVIAKGGGVITETTHKIVGHSLEDVEGKLDKGLGKKTTRKEGGR